MPQSSDLSINQPINEPDNGIKPLITEDDTDTLPVHMEHWHDDQLSLSQAPIDNIFPAYIIAH